MFNRISKRLRTVLNIFEIFFSQYYFSFIRSHNYLSSYQLDAIDNEHRNPNPETIFEYEEKFSKLIGDGEAVSFAAGRMAFFSLLKVLRIQENDEVIILGFTCSVMPNAVLRCGAKPIYIDLDDETLGSLKSSIEDRISPNTKMIVVQHSFGIPSKIDEIIKLAKKKNIFVLEDSAISLGSKLKGVSVGNWGDAAIFSTDHTKPLNTIIGGLVYSRNISLIKEVRKYQNDISDLSKDHCKRIFSQFLFEKKYFGPKLYGKTKYLSSIKTRLSNNFVYLENDYSKPNTDKIIYPYPAKLPTFLARLGIFEIEQWSKEKDERIELMNRYLQIVQKNKLKELVPLAYFSDDYEIIPHRFCFFSTVPQITKNHLKNKLDVDSIWFDETIVCTDDPLGLGYVPGLCKSAEKASKMIINFPTSIEKKYQSQVLKIFEEEIIFLSEKFLKNDRSI